MAAGGLREKHKKRRLKQVLDAADRLFTKHGYEATRIETIADSASVAPATVYNYFSTKPNLLMELALRHVKAALPERRAYLRDLPDDIFAGVLGLQGLAWKRIDQHGITHARNMACINVTQSINS